MIKLKHVEDTMIKIATHYSEKIIVGTDIDNKIYVYITNIDRITRKKYLVFLEGRGYTYHLACVNYLENALNKTFNIRHKKELYATRYIRRLIKRRCIRKDLLCLK